MSSVLAFARAIIMLSCLVALPVFAFSQGSWLHRARQTAARYWDRLSGDSQTGPIGGNEESTPPLRRAHSRVNRVVRAEQPAANKLWPLLPAPVNEVPVRAEPPRLPAPTGAPPEGELSEAGDRSPPPLESPVEPFVAEWEIRASTLQHLGAVEYSLEKWGESGRLYRFRCLAAAEGRQPYRRHFQAVSEDGARAVDEVIHQVRSWRTSAAAVP